MRGRISDKVKHHFEEILNSPSGFAKFKRIMAAVKKEETYLQYFREAMDRKFGKAPQFLEMELNDVSDRPTVDELNVALRSLNGHSKRTGLPKEV